MVQKNKGFIQFFVLFFIIMYLAFEIVTPIVNKKLSPSEAFGKFVCCPIPKSVIDIKMDRLIRWNGWHRYVFHFKIDESDLSSILNSKPFKEVSGFEYTGSGHLSWKYPGSESRQGFSLYMQTSSTPAPEWFKLQNWENPKVYLYMIRDVYRLRFLVYNKKLGEAYFIDYRAPD